MKPVSFGARPNHPLCRPLAQRPTVRRAKWPVVGLAILGGCASLLKPNPDRPNVIHNYNPSSVTHSTHTLNLILRQTVAGVLRPKSALIKLRTLDAELEKMSCAIMHPGQMHLFAGTDLLADYQVINLGRVNEVRGRVAEAIGKLTFATTGECAGD